MSLKYFPLCLLFALLVTTGNAATYYVSPTGDDGHAGTSLEGAWASINKVNSSTFLPGDSILFMGGVVFEGNLFFGEGIQGTAAQPIVLASYGTGRAIISSGGSYGFKAYNTAGFRIERLVFQGAGRENNKASGIEFYMDLPNTRLPYVHIDSVDVSGYHDSGIVVGSWKGSSGFDDISITRSAVHENGDAGISSYAEARLGHKNMYVGYNKVYNNSGLPEKTHLHSGNGIVLGGVDGALIEYCEAYNNGWLNAWKGGGPVGIWGWHCNNLVIQYNESHHNKTGTGKDGGGFDIDGGCTDCSMQYNYSHDNEGAGYLVAQYYYAPAMKGIVVRYNISENDARKNGYGAIHLWSSGSNGGIQDAEIYNNTIYLTPAAHGTPRGIYVQSGGLKNVRIYNNIIQTTGGLELLYIDKLTDLRFEGNNYWPSGKGVKIKWGSTNYTSLDSWMAATGQEQRDGQVVGTLLDPALTEPGKGINFTEPGTLYQLAGYQLQPGSPLIGKGLDLAELGIKTGSVDFWGNNIEKRSTYCIGAHQLTDNTNVCLNGGQLSLSFGKETGGTYTGKGVDQEGNFNPELAGQGKHGILYAYTDAEGQPQWDTHTFTVANTASTVWKGAGASNDWFDSENWSACVPTATIDAQVPAPSEATGGEEDVIQPVIMAGRYAMARNLIIPGKLRIENGASLEINDRLSGVGLAADSGSIIIFKSAATQSIPGAAFSKLHLQGAGSKVLEGDVSVSQELVLEDKLFLGDNALIMKKGSTIVSSGATAYVVTDALGSLTFEQLGEGDKAVFPIGTATNYTPAIVENAGLKDDYSLRVEEGVWEDSTPDSPAMKGMVNRTWHVEEKIPGGSDVTLSLQWNEEDEMVDFDRSNSYVTHFENGKWSRPGEEQHGGTASLRKAGESLVRSMGKITSLSPFSVGSHNTTLPVMFAFFTLERQNRDVQLHWETAGEKNNSGFDIEVSTDGKQYRTLGFVASSSPDLSHPQEYSFLDEEPGKYGTRYYRLKQIDFDGTFSFSPVQSIVFEEGEVDMSLFPNPFTDNIQLEINASEEGILQLQISDGLGRIVKARQINLQKGMNRISLSLEEALPAGLYLLAGRMHGAAWQQKIMKK